MKILVVRPSKGLKGSLEVPGDKSVSHRSIMLGSLAHGITKVKHFLPSADCLSTLSIFKSMGVRIRQKGSEVVIHGRGLNSLKPPKKPLDAGNSGTTSRILLGLLAGQSFRSKLTGDKYLRRRPMRRVVGPLSQMGAQFNGPEGGNLLPLTVQGGKLRGITYTLPVASAQVKSSILMAGLFANGTTTVIEPIPTRDHTERMFATFGVPFIRKGDKLSIEGPIKPFVGRNLLVPGDISSAAFFIVAALLVPGSKVTLKNVGVNPTRTGLLDVLRRMGARIEVTPRPTVKGGEPVADLTIRHSPLKGIEVGGAIVPRMVDEFPVFAVAATQAQGKTVVRGAEDLKVKESDRILMMASTLKKMGADITPTADGWIIQGPCALRGTRLSSGGDHRVAMSLAVAGLIAAGSTTILDTENIDTSFPGFQKCLKKLARI